MIYPECSLKCKTTFSNAFLLLFDTVFVTVLHTLFEYRLRRRPLPQPAQNALSNRNAPLGAPLVGAHAYTPRNALAIPTPDF